MLGAILRNRYPGKNYVDNKSFGRTKWGGGDRQSRLLYGDLPVANRMYIQKLSGGYVIVESTPYM